MSKTLSIGKQAYSFFSGRVISQIINILIMLLLARTLKSINYGIFSLATTMVIFLYSLFNLGIETSISYYIPKAISNKNKILVKKIMNSVVFIRIITGIIGALILYSSSNLIESIYNINGLGNIIKIFSFGFLGYSITYLGPSIFQAFKKFKLSALMEITLSLIKFTLIIITIQYGLMGVSIGFNSALLISALIMIFVFYKITPHIKNQFFAFRKIFKYSMIVYLGTVSTFIIGYIGNLLVGSFPSEVSFLTIGNKIGSFIILPASALGIVLFPNISGMNNKKEIIKIYNTIIRYNLLITSFLSALILVCGDKLITFILGNTYSGSGLIINTLTIGYFLNSIYIPVFNLYHGIKKPHIVTYALITQGLISLIVALILTPILKGYGAAIAFVISNLIISLYSIIKSIKDNYNYNISYLIRISIVLIFSSSAYFLNDLLTKITTFIILFLITGFLTKTIKINDFKILIKTIKQKNI